MPKEYSLKDLEELEKKQRKSEQRVMLVAVLVLGIGGILISWYFALSKGMYNRLLVFISPALVIGAIYSALFPNDFTDKPGKESLFRKWIVIILGLLLCFAHLLAFEYGFF